MYFTNITTNYSHRILQLNVMFSLVGIVLNRKKEITKEKLQKHTLHKLLHKLIKYIYFHVEKKLIDISFPLTLL